MTLQHTYVDPQTTDAKLISMIVKAHYHDVLSHQELEILAEVVAGALKRITDNTAAIHIHTYSELLNPNMKHIEMPVYYVSKDVGTVVPNVTWAEPYAYMYKVNKNEMDTNMLIMVGVKCFDNVRVTRIK